ncbi:uncharacterized protein LOC109597484 [Aethina tumida]|uniref:uncharacterized protein LOC109597484 n=1 Tax=Aethina tumida TaxID=116153 RepID=UPI00214812BB|nr:uncharacterized protein LOC109597484 [Aethina tumida]
MTEDKMSARLLLSIVLWSLVFTSAIAIKCFQCNSAVDPGCADLKKEDTNSTYYKECSGDYKFCRKIHSSILGDDDKLVRIHRQCGWILTKNDSNCKTSDTDFILKKNCVCWSDGCNSSNRIQVDFTVVLLIIAVYKLVC